jgi:ABC-type multidrug transport system fused ATPase/permease subunit
MADNVTNKRFTVWMVIKEFVDTHPWLLVFWIITLLMVPLNDILVPHFTGKLVDAISKGGNIWKAFAIVMGLLIVVQIGVGMHELHEMKIFPIMQHFIREKMITHILEKNSIQYDEQETGKIIAKLLKAPAAIYNFLDMYKMTIIPHFITSLCAICYFVYHDWRLGVAFAVMIAIVYYIVFTAPQRCHDVSMQRDQVFNQIHEDIEDVLRNIVPIFNLNQLEGEKQRLRDMQAKYTNLNRDTIKCALSNKTVIMPVQLVFVLFFMYTCYSNVKSKRMKTGTFVSLFIIAMYMFNNSMSIGAQLRDVVTRYSVLEDFLANFNPAEIAALKQRMQSNDATHPEKTMRVDPNTFIQFKDVTFTYPKGSEPILRNFNMSIAFAERVLIVGRIGSGKTSILRLLMRYQYPTHGHIYLAGLPYSRIDTADIRGIIGYVPQYPILFNRTIYENITYGNPHVTKADVMSLLQRLNLTHLFDNKEMGLDQKAGKSGSALSGGQRQIIWILRVMLQNPDVLLLDEPTASVDDATKEIIYTLVDVMIKERPRTVIIVSHDYHIQSIANRIVEMRDGQIISDKKLASQLTWA